MLVLLFALVAAASVADPRLVLPGPAIPAQPEQRLLKEGPRWTQGRYKIKGLAEYHLNAVVLRTQRYQTNREAELSPIDLVLGWGAMSDRELTTRVSVSQKDRFYFYSWQGRPAIASGTIVTNSANVHVVPATKLIEEAAMKVRPGQVISLSGKLIQARADDGWTWKSSLSRGDVGKGSCELFWVEQLTVLE